MSKSSSFPKGSPILVVDDKNENLVAFRAILENANYDVVTSNSGVEALKHLMKNEVSLILMDVQMPEINGFETARLVRQKQKFADLPILFISATQLSDDFVKQGYSSEGYDYITKPVDSEILVSKVELFRRLYLQQKLLEERNKAVEERNAALANNANLKVASKAKDDFLASVSHELRTPLTAILGYCDLLRSSGLSAEQQNQLNAIKLAGQSQLALVNDLLDLSKIQAGRFSIDREPYSLHALLVELESMYGYRSEAVSFTIENELELEHQLLGDCARVRQILINLLSNAFKFTQKGSVALRIGREEGKLQFIVSDTGIGIAPGNLDKLFKQFEQIDQSITRKFGGTGLGLAISQSLADLMNGEITVSSQLGTGSEFTLSIPFELSEKSDAHSSVIAPTVTKRFNGRVLVVEDTPTLQVLVTMLLEKLGLEVHVANDGLEATEMIRNSQFDLVLMDMHMPRMDGLEATAVIKRYDKQIPIIALTANVSAANRQEFISAGADGFLEKPISTDALHEILAYHLELISVHSGSEE